MPIEQANEYFSSLPEGFAPAEGRWERDLRFPPLPIRLLEVQ